MAKLGVTVLPSAVWHGEAINAEKGLATGVREPEATRRRESGYLIAYVTVTSAFMLV